MSVHKNVSELIASVEGKNVGEKEFHQAVREVAETIFPFIDVTHAISRVRFLSASWSPSVLSAFVCHG
jgi:hypothetical protein